MIGKIKSIIDINPYEVLNLKIKKFLIKIIENKILNNQK